MDELKNKRIFIVEDDITNMAVFSATLRRSGATVFRDIWNVGAALHIAQYLPVDVILLDLMLRNQISGYDVFDEIRNTPTLAHIPVIIVSAADPSVEIPKAQAKRLNGFIGKPIRPRVFASQIAACING